MGVTRFKTIVLKDKKLNEALKTSPPSNVEGVSLDMNGNIHAVLGMVYGYNFPYTYSDAKKKRELEKIKILFQENPDLIKDEFFAKLSDKLKEIINTLKPKQYFIIAVDGVANAAKGNQQKGRRYKKDLMLINSEDEPMFNTSEVSTGTNFMVEVSAFFEKWIKENNKFLPKIVIYSSHLVKGEGEHKIFDILRSSPIEEGNGAHVVIGLDADLCMLSSLCPFENVVLVRENYKDVVDISILRTKLKGIMLKTWPNVKSSEDIKIRNKLLIQDFCLLTFLMGNDFLPHTLALEDVGKLFTLLDFYNEGRKHITDINGNIQWEEFLFILEKLSEIEPELIQEIADKEWKFPSPLLDDIYKNDEYDDKFLYFRTKWYNNALLPRNKNNLYPSIPVNVSTDEIFNMCESYIFGLQW
ncbi:MAG TPA: hypothetical protein V6C58_00005, partial [Allocoleopsis sp.]